MCVCFIALQVGQPEKRVAQNQFESHQFGSESGKVLQSNFRAYFAAEKPKTEFFIRPLICMNRPCQRSKSFSWFDCIMHDSIQKIFLLAFKSYFAD